MENEFYVLGVDLVKHPYLYDVWKKLHFIEDKAAHKSFIEQCRIIRDKNNRWNDVWRNV